MASALDRWQKARDRNQVTETKKTPQEQTTQSTRQTQQESDRWEAARNRMGPVKPNIVAPESTEVTKPNVTTPTTNAMDYSAGPFAAPKQEPVKKDKPKDYADLHRERQAATKPLTLDGPAAQFKDFNPIAQEYNKTIQDKLQKQDGQTLNHKTKVTPSHFEKGNIDLNNRPVVKNSDGTISTVRTISFNDNGKEVLIPTVSDDGRIVSDDEAIDTYYKTGKYFGKFNTIEEANTYAEWLHNQQEKMYASPKKNYVDIDNLPPLERDRAEQARRAKMGTTKNMNDSVITSVDTPQQAALKRFMERLIWGDPENSLLDAAMKSIITDPLGTLDKLQYAKPVQDYIAGSGDIASNMAHTVEAFGGDKVPILKDALKAIDEEGSRLSSKGGTSFWSKVMRSAPQSVNTIILAIASGGYSIPAQLGGNATLQTIKNTITSPTFINTLVHTFGGAYDEAIKDGQDRPTAITKALIQSIPESLIEQAGGLETIVSKLENMTYGLFGTALMSGLEEGLEEIFQYPLDALSKKITYAPETPWYSTTETAVINPPQMLESGAVGLTSGGLFGGGTQMVSDIKSYMSGVQTQQNVDVKANDGKSQNLNFDDLRRMSNKIESEATQQQATEQQDAVQPKPQEAAPVKTQEQKLDEAIKQQQGIVDDLSYRKFYLEHDVEAELETEAVKLEELKAEKEKLLADRQAEAERAQRAYDYEQGNISLEQIMAESEVRDTKTDPKTITVNKVTTVRSEPKIDKTYRQQYNNIDEIKTQISKYYDNVPDVNKELVDSGAQAIADLQKTENLYRGVPEKLTGVQNDLRGDSGALPGQKPYKTVGKAFSNDLINTGKVNLSGVTFNNIEDLAVLSQVYRDPRFETFRIIYTKGNSIVGTDAITSRMPGSAVVFLGSNKSQHFNRISDRMKRMQADGYYLLHNHPGKTTKPSRSDLGATQAYAKNISGFKGHLIINSNKYTEIYQDAGFLKGNEDMPLSLGDDLLYNPAIEHPLLNKEINSATKLAQIAKQVQLDKEVSIAFFTDAKNTVRGILEINNSMIKNAEKDNFRNFLRNQATELGGRNVLMVGGKTVEAELRELIRNGDITDGIIENEFVSIVETLSSIRDQDAKNLWMGKDANKGKALRPAKPSETIYKKPELIIPPTTLAIKKPAIKPETIKTITGHEDVLPETKPVGVVPEQSIQGERFIPQKETLDDSVAQLEAAPTKVIQRITGNTIKAYDNDNKGYEFKYAVVSADDLIASHDINMNQNPSYPQELQPRDRERIASKIQVDKMAVNIQPELLGESPKIQDGAPIIGGDNVVESGNGRVIALKKMYQATKANKEKYVNWLKNNADKFGIDVNNMPENPVLVRVRQTDVDRNEFAKKANEASVALMSSTETAKSDAERLTDRILELFEASEDGTINTAGNRPFIAAFTKQIIPSNEVGKYITPEGYLSQDGLARVRNAIFYKAYGSDRLLTKISESTDNNIKNITNSLINVAPKIIKIKDGINRGVYYDIDYSADIIGAVEQYLNLKNSKLSVDEYLQQELMFDDGVSASSKVILSVIDKNSRSAKKVTEFLNTVLEAVEELGNPDQVNLFGEQNSISKDELIKYVYGRFDEGGQQTFEQITENRSGEGQENKRVSGPEDGRKEAEGKRKKGEKVNALTSSVSVPLPQGTGTGMFAKTMDDLVEIIENFTGVPIRTGKFKQRALGIFKVKSEVIRTKIKNDLPVICHELGHYLDKKHGFYGSAQHDGELIPLGRVTSRESYTQTAIRKEGVAEFLRVYLTDHIRAKHVAPKFFAHFESVIGYDELNFLSQLRTDVTSIINLKSENRVYNSVSSFEGRTTTTKKAPLFHRLVDQWIDKDAVVGRMDKEARSKGYTGVSLKTTFTNLRGIEAQVENMIMDEQRDLSGKKIFKSLAEIFKPISKKSLKKLGFTNYMEVRENFISYMISRRAMDYRDRGMVMPDTWATYADTITRMEGKYGKIFTDLFADIRTWEDNSLQMLVDSGIKSKQEVEVIKLLNANHIPLQRIQESIDVIRAGAGSSIGQNKQVIKKAYGSGKTIIDPIESIITNAFIITRAAKSNYALGLLSDMAGEVEGMGKWMEAVPYKTKSESFTVKDIRAQMMKIAKDSGNTDFVDTLEKLSDEELESGLSIFKMLPKEGDNEITIYKNGKETLYEVDSELYKAVKGLNKEQSNIVIRVLNVPKRILQAGVVTTVDFMTRNIARDTSTSLMQSDYGINPIDIVKGYWSALTKDEIYREFVAMGGGSEYYNINSRTEAQKLEDNVLGYGFTEKFKRFRENIAELKVNNNERTRAKLAQSVTSLISFIPDGIRSLVDWSEMGPRVAEYKKGIEKGYSADEAASKGRGLSQDFKQSGYYGKEVNKVDAFFNANTQGTTRLVETFAKHPIRTTFRGFMYITLPTLLLYFINYDDEEYQGMPTWKKALFWNIPKGDGKFISIPRPYGYSFIFGAVPEIILDRLLIDDTKTFDRIKDTFIQNFDIPIGVSALTPIIEMKSNKRWNDTPIEGTWDRKNYPAYLIQDEKTSTISKTLGNLFKNEGGLSPKQMDHLIKGYFGSVGEYIYRLPDKIEDGIKMPVDWTELPIVKGFITDSVYSTDSVNDLYNYNSELTTRAKEYKLTDKYSALKGRPDVKKRMEELDALRKESNQVIAKLVDARKAIGIIQKDTTLTKDVKDLRARQIKRGMNKEAEFFNKKYEQYKKKYNIK